MTNIKLVRAFIKKMFNVNPNQIVLASEPIEPTTSFQDDFSHGSMYDTNYTVNVWGFSKEKGFLELENISGHYERNANGSMIDRPGLQLQEHELVKNNSFVFFYVQERGGYQDNNREEDYTKDTLYKSPNFKEYWSSIEKEDIDRWENWIND